MILRSYIFKRVAIIGVGLMGGSLGKALKKRKLVKEVIGISHRQQTLDKAVKNEAIDLGFTDIQKGVSRADLVVLATPVRSILRLLSSINPYLRRGCIVTDVGSAKVEIVEEAEKKLSSPGFFAGSHPLSGSEKKGVDFASADLFEDSYCIMTPTSKTNQVAKGKVKHLWTKLGAKVEFLSPQEHDRILSCVSHLPHLVSYGLIESIPKETLKYASQGLKDVSRIAASSPEMWSDVCLANSRNILNALDELVKHLAVFRKTIITQDSKTLIRHFSEAKNKRNELK